MSSMVEIDALTKRFGPITAVNGISFAVQRGEVLGFLGPNGAGKSTTMKMVTGFLTPDSGSVRVGGYDLARHPIEVKSRIGYLPEGAPLYGDMTAAAFLAFVADIRGLTGANKRRRIAEVVERVHLGEVLAQPTETLSKGFKRRVGLAQAILHDPEVLILDEPTDGLDPNQKHEVRQLIAEMAADKAIILSTHILEEVDAVCTRAVIIARGDLLADGTPEQLLAQSPDHNAVRLQLSGADPATVSALLETLQGVSEVQHVPLADGVTEYRVRPLGGAALVGPVGDAVRAQGWRVRSLHTERGRLDDVFRRITSADGAA